MPQLAPITLVAPGSKGLNKEREFNLLTPEWATEASNCVISLGGRLASRSGWADQTTNAIAGTPTIDVMHEYKQKDGTTFIISAAGNKIFKGIQDFTNVANDITSLTAPTADHWKFINFNNKVLGFQRGHTPIEWSGSGDFTDASYTGTGPDGNDAVAAFGRVWAIDADLQTVRYSALLDDTDYSTASGGGSVDMSSVWTQGMDQIVAITAFGSNLVVFGKNHIVIWADGTGSEIGLNPINMYVVDTIEGTGCIARDSVQPIGEGDVFYLSRHGIQSLGRTIQNKTNPVGSVTAMVSTQLKSSVELERIGAGEFDTIRSVFSPENSMYLLILPTAEEIFYVDTRSPYTDAETGDLRYPICTWNVGGNPTSFLARQNGALLLGSAGVVGLYSGDSDNGVGFTMSFWSAWLDLGELNERLKMLKELSAIIQIGGSGSATYRWEFDWTGDSESATITYAGQTAAEYGIAEYNIDEYSGALSVQRKAFPGRGQGQFLRIGATLSINGFGFVLQQMQLVPAVGRLVI
jgi:hypothetical protein